MSRLTNYAENKLADFFRGQGWTFPTSFLFAGLASAASDSSITELAGTGYARQSLSRSLTVWSGTQGAGTTLASTGTSHTTSNNNLIDFGTSGAAWGTANFVVLFDSLTSGNPLIYLPLSSPIVIGNGDPVSLAIGSVVVSVGLVDGATDYLANRLIDFIFRGQAYSFPATIYNALFTAAPTNAGGGTEVVGGSYGRASLVPSLANISGTQSAGSTSASSGTGGVISNNVAVTHPTPTANWGDIVAEGFYDASTGGNLLLWAAVSPRTVSLGTSAPSHAAASISITFA